MQQLETDFFDTYKRLDLICRDMYPSEDPERQGVKAYLAAMDTNAYSGRNLVRNWDRAYHTIHHLRIIRNQISHDPISDCTSEDLTALNAFYRDIMTQQDPLALLEKARRIRTYKKAYSKNASEFDESAESSHNNVGIIFIAILVILLLLCFSSLLK